MQGAVKPETRRPTSGLPPSSTPPPLPRALSTRPISPVPRPPLWFPPTLAARAQQLLQLVFHFAKHEDIRRMVNAMDIALLVDRVRDAFLATKGEFLTKDVNLPSPVASDVDITFRVGTARSVFTYVSFPAGGRNVLCNNTVSDTT